MFRTAGRRIFLVSAAVMAPLAVVNADRAPLDPRLKTLHVVPHTVAQRQTTPLELIASGMRRKSFYVVAVDVYMTGLNMLPKVSQKVRQAGEGKAIDVVMGLAAENPFPEASTCITMHFVRDVTTAQCVDAFKDAFKGCNPEGIARFGAVMTEAVGENGCKVGDEVSFYWLEGGGLAIDRAGTKPYVVRDAEIERRLLEVYLDPARTVSPDLLKSFKDYLSSA